MNHFFDKLISRPVAVSMFYGTLLVGGIVAFLHLPLELAPEKEYPRLTISTSWGRTSPETIEMLITAPIEEITNTVQGVRKVTSTSGEGSSGVTVEFEQKIDMNFARLELSEKLATFAENRPVGATAPVIGRYVPRDFQNLQGFLTYSLSGGSSAQVLRKYAEETIAPQLLSVKGVADAKVYGGEQRELQVLINPEKVLSLGISSQEISDRLSELEYNRPIGTVEEEGGTIVVSIRNASSSIRDLECQIIAHLPGGTPVRLGEIGTVRDGTSESLSISRINGKPAVTITINKEPGVNTLSLADAVVIKLKELKHDFPHGLTLLKESDKSEKLRADLQTLYQEIIISLLCIGAVLTLFLRNFKASLLVLSSILFSIAGTFMLFWLFDVGLNLLTMAGLVLGFGRLVDDSIVVLDNIFRHSNPQDNIFEAVQNVGRVGNSSTLSVRKLNYLQSFGVCNTIDNDFLDSLEGRGPGNSRAEMTVSYAVHEITLPVVASTITTVGALLPLEFLPPDLKPYFRDFGIAVAVSLLMSLLVSFTLIPTAAHRLSLQPFGIQLFEWIGAKGLKLYKAILCFALSRKKLVIILALWIFGLPVWLIPEKVNEKSVLEPVYSYTFGSNWYQSARPYLNYALGGTSYLFFEKVSKGEIWSYAEATYLSVWVRFRQGTEMERFDAIAADVENRALAYGAGIKKVTTRVAEGSASIRIDIADSAAMTSLPYDLKNELTLYAAQTGGASISVSGFGPGFYSGSEGGSMNFRQQILGYNYNRVREIAEEFSARLQRNPRVADVDIEGGWGKYFELFITIDRDACSKHGITVNDAVAAVLTHTQGTVSRSTLNLGGERIPYLVKYEGYRDFSVDDLGKAVIVNANGDRVRLAGVMAIEERRVPAQIERANQQYMRTVSFEYKGPWQYGSAYVENTIKSMALPSGYQFADEMSWFRFREEQTISLLLIAFCAIVIVFMVTASLYESFIKPFMVILAVPMSLVGLFLAFYLFEVPFGRGGYAAVVLLIGIVVTNSVVLVDYLAHRAQGERKNVDVLLEAASTRLRPILMTTLTTIGGMMPLLLMGEKSSIWYQLSLGTIGGLVSSMLLTLIIVPVMYAKVYGVRKVGMRVRV